MTRTPTSLGFVCHAGGYLRSLSRAVSRRIVRGSVATLDRPETGRTIPLRMRFPFLWMPSESAKAKKKRGEHRLGRSGPPFAPGGSLINKPREERDCVNW
jgi:hypothetical protein